MIRKIVTVKQMVEGRDCSGGLVSVQTASDELMAGRLKQPPIADGNLWCQLVGMSQSVSDGRFSSESLFRQSNRRCSFVASEMGTFTTNENCLTSRIAT